MTERCAYRDACSVRISPSDMRSVFCTKRIDMVGVSKHAEEK